MKTILMMVLLILPTAAYADWPQAGMRPVLTPNMSPNHGQPMPQGHINVAPTLRVAPQHSVQPPVRQESKLPVYFRHDTKYYRYDHPNFSYGDVDIPMPPTVPDGLEAVAVDGQTYFYSDGVFYQQIDDQLVAIPAVIGAVVDSIPQDYQIVMADSDHYLFTGGVYYQRVDNGFEVVQPPVSEDS